MLPGACTVFANHSETGMKNEYRISFSLAYFMAVLVDSFSNPKGLKEATLAGEEGFVPTI